LHSETTVGGAVKHLLRLYPTRWRRRYQAEVADLLDHQDLSLPTMLDLFRGALDARLRGREPHVFVPTLGFRPLGTRILLASTDAEWGGTRLHAVALAASPRGTDVP